MVAIEVSLPDSAVVEEGDTIFPHARALNGYGDSVAATIVWATLDTASLLVLDTLTGASQGKKPSNSARLQARVGALLSTPLVLAVRAQADTLFAPGAIRDTVDASVSVDSLSDSLIVRLQADTGGIKFDLAGRRVVFQIIYPAGAGAFTLQPQDTVLTAASGRAAVRTRLVNRTLPDSVVVEARALRANGQTVPGSPVTFVVEYVP